MTPASLAGSWRMALFSSTTSAVMISAPWVSCHSSRHDVAAPVRRMVGVEPCVGD